MLAGAQIEERYLALSAARDDFRKRSWEVIPARHGRGLRSMPVSRTPLPSPQPTVRQAARW